MTEFALQIKKWAGDTEEKQSQFVRKICLDLTSQVVLGTPVDTGRARANWQASINRPAIGTTAQTDRGGGVTIGEASSVLKDAPGNVFYLSNNLPYIYRLEFEGWSKQAPQGWVRAAVNKIAATFR